MNFTDSTTASQRADTYSDERAKAVVMDLRRCLTQDSWRDICAEFKSYGLIESQPCGAQHHPDGLVVLMAVFQIDVAKAPPVYVLQTLVKKTLEQYDCRLQRISFDRRCAGSYRSIDDGPSMPMPIMLSYLDVELNYVTFEIHGDNTGRWQL